MSAPYTPERIEELRRIAAELDYDAVSIAAREHVVVATVWSWSCNGWLTPPGRTMRQMQAEARARARAETLAAALQREAGDLDAVARALHLSPGTVREQVRRAGLNEARTAASAPKRCAWCQREFQSFHQRKRYCSRACADDANKNRSARRKRIQYYGDAHAVTRYERIDRRYRDAIWAAWGELHVVARALNVSTEAVFHWVAHDEERRAFVERARARRRSPEQLRQHLEEHGWNIGEAQRTLPFGARQLSRHLRRIGARDVAAMVPCIQCGKTYDRSAGGTRRGCCGDECRRERERIRSRERYHRMKQMNGASAATTGTSQP